MNISDKFIDSMAGCIAVTSASGSVALNDFFAFEANESTVVSSLEHSDNTGTNVIDSYKLQGVTLTAGRVIVSNKGSYFSQITLASGSVICYKRE